MTYEQHRAGANAAIVALIVLIVQLFIGGEPPAWVTALTSAVIGLVAIITSVLFPRWQGNNHLTKHPAGWVGAVTVIFSIVVPLVKPEVTPENMTVIVGGVIAIMSLLTPVRDGADLNRDRIGT